MKKSLLCLLFAVACGSMAFAQDASTGSGNAGQGQRAGKWKAAFAQLNLTDAQKAQIKQIRSTVTDRKERRQEIMAVLTPEQKHKLWRLIKAQREAAQSGTPPSGT